MTIGDLKTLYNLLIELNSHIEDFSKELLNSKYEVYRSSLTIQSAIKEFIDNLENKNEDEN